MSNGEAEANPAERTPDVRPPDVQPHYVRPDVAAVLAMLNNAGGPELDTLPLADARAAYQQMGALLEADPLPLAVIRDLACPGPAGEIPLRLYDAREQRDPGPVVMFFHGGGFVIGDLETHHALCTALAAGLDLPVVAVDYRLAPEHPFPAAPDDCEAAARWVAGAPAALGRTPTGLVTTGDSAGGNLTIVVTQALMDRPAAVPVVLQAPIYPVSDDQTDHASMQHFAEGHLLTARAMAWFSQSYAAEAGNARAFPIHGDHANLPPTVLVTASLDPIRDSGRVYGEALVRAGANVLFLEMKGSVHGFVNLRKAVPSAEADLQRVLGAMRWMLANG